MFAQYKRASLILSWVAACQLLSLPSTSEAKAKKEYPLELLYRDAQREFHRRNYKEALPKLEEYIDRSRKVSYKRERLFWVIDQVGRIHLRVNRNPDAAIKFFKSISKDKRLDDAELVTLEEWLGAAKDWKKLGKPPKKSKPEELFKLGKRFFDRGKMKANSPRDDEGNVDFHVAAVYLVPFIVNNDADKRVGEALLMMGTIRRHILNDNEYWSENYYLKEVIRRYPHSKIALKAYKELEEEIHYGYTGSSGDNTPPSMIRMLETFKKLAQPTKKSS